MIIIFDGFFVFQTNFLRHLKTDFLETLPRDVALWAISDFVDQNSSISLICHSSCCSCSCSCWQCWENSPIKRVNSNSNSSNKKMSFKSNSTQLLWSELNQIHELNELTLQIILFKNDPKCTTIIARLHCAVHMANVLLVRLKHIVYKFCTGMLKLLTVNDRSDLTANDKCHSVLILLHLATTFNGQTSSCQ